MCAYNNESNFLYLEPRGSEVIVRMGRNNRHMGYLPVDGEVTNCYMSGGWPQGYTATVSIKSGRTQVFRIDSGMNFTPLN